jgi:hypothetical protein
VSVASVLACVVMAAVRSTGLTEITVTALDPDAEPRDHRLPFVKQKEALPDYRIIVKLNNGDRIRLGAKPDTSAANGLSWQLSDPISLSGIASIRLDEEDKLISDAIAEVQITDESVTHAGYRFDFHTSRSAAVGVKSFFRTPIGRAITAGFFVAVLVIILSLFCV